MSIHNELQNIRQNRSGNEAIRISTRSGEEKEVNTRFDLMASAEPSAFDIVSSSDQKEERAKFLTAYFSLLKRVLNKFEFEYCKELFTTDQTRKEICENIGVSNKLAGQVAQKIAEHHDEIQELTEQSEWKHATLFAHCFNGSKAELTQRSKDNKILYEAETPRGSKGFKAYYEAQIRRAYRRGYAAGHEAKKRKALLKVRGIMELFEMCFDFDKLNALYEGAKEGGGEEMARYTVTTLYTTGYDHILKELEGLLTLVYSDCVGFNEYEEENNEQQGEQE